MNGSFQIEAESQDGLSDLFGAMTDEEEAFEAEGITFQATTKKSSAFGVGMPDVADLIISLGSAGVFTAITTVLINYFRRRPAGKITLRTKDGEKSVTFTAENCDAEAVAKAMKGILSNSGH